MVWVAAGAVPAGVPADDRLVCAVAWVAVWVGVWVAVWVVVWVVTAASTGGLELFTVTLAVAVVVFSGGRLD